MGAGGGIFCETRKRKEGRRLKCELSPTSAGCERDGRSGGNVVQVCGRWEAPVASSVFRVFAQRCVAPLTLRGAGQQGLRFYLDV